MSSQRGPAARPLSVGVIGLGAMGTPMAANLLRASRCGPVLVTHRGPDRVRALLDAGAVWADTARVLAAADVVVSVLPDLPQLEEVLDGDDGLLAGIQRPTVLVISSTSSADGVRELDHRLRERTDGLLRVVDAPVSGGEDGAAAGTLSVMVGGDEAAVRDALPVLQAFGNPVHLGPLGSGQIAKSCNQLIVASTIMALGEAAVLAARSGLDVGALFDLLEGGYAGSRILATRKDRIVQEDYRPSGPAKFMIKDLRYASEEAARTGTSATQLASLLTSFQELAERGFGDQDIAVTRAYVDSLTPAPEQSHSPIAPPIDH